MSIYRKTAKDTAAMNARAAELKQLAELENEVASLRLQVAEKDVEVATLKRQVANLMGDRDEQDLRIGWIRALTDGRQQRPNQLHDPKRPGRWVPV